MKKSLCKSCLNEKIICLCPKPEAPTEGCDEHKRFIPHCEDCIAPKPAKDAGAREWSIFRKTHSDKSDCRIAGPDCELTKVIEYAAYEKLERELAEAEEMLEMADAAKNELCDGYKEDLTQERTRAAGLFEALELLADPNWDGSFCDVETIAREALEKYKKS